MVRLTDYIISRFAELFEIKRSVSPEIIEYVEKEIIPRYASFDKAHRENHVRMVVGQSLKLAGHTPSIDSDMVYVIAAFHDLGIVNGRENHHKESRKILQADEFIKARFIDAETIIRRTIQYGLANHPQLDRAGHYQRTIEHLKDKYGPEGYLKIWIPWSDNSRNLKTLHALLTDTAQLDEIFNRIFDEETRPAE